MWDSNHFTNSETFTYLLTVNGGVTSGRVFKAMITQGLGTIGSRTDLAPVTVTSLLWASVSALIK